MRTMASPLGDQGNLSQKKTKVSPLRQRPGYYYHIRTRGFPSNRVQEPPLRLRQHGVSPQKGTRSSPLRWRPEPLPSDEDHGWCILLDRDQGSFSQKETRVFPIWQGPPRGEMDLSAHPPPVCTSASVWGGLTASFLHSFIHSLRNHSLGPTASRQIQHIQLFLQSS